jgi:hypothetical protein
MLKPIGPDQSGGAADLAANNGREILSQKTGIFGQKTLKTAQKRAKIRSFFLRESGVQLSIKYSFHVSYMHMQGYNRSYSQGEGVGVLGV